MTPLTLAQQQLVEDNHQLIYGYAYANGLKVDDWYDVLAIALCRAAQLYDESKGAFSTLAYKAMRNHYLHTVRRETGLQRCIPANRIVSLQAICNNSGSAIDEPSTYEQMIPDQNIMIDRDVTEKVVIDSILETVPQRNKEILFQWIDGKTINELAAQYSCSKQNISSIINRIRKKIKEAI